MDALRFLMDARSLKQEDLSAIVPQGNLSSILAGKRKISASMVGKLGKFFGISPAVFVPRKLDSSYPPDDWEPTAAKNCFKSETWHRLCIPTWIQDGMLRNGARLEQ